ncbi:DUF541 domain-containing protein [Aureibaculum algae]|uniref:DUF541 domain-containing protein n=1 Tax=Aureibaculum algae TaxID=2584122 RepID=A0A5B7TWM9_9FLAO|nr:SIMPL domain-containing protein [Aureibaculum algae]QCX39072.1 DUF541 domain-containing protein [Aureibaculum algae]
MKNLIVHIIFLATTMLTFAQENIPYIEVSGIVNTEMTTERYVLNIEITDFIKYDNLPENVNKQVVKFLKTKENYFKKLKDVGIDTEKFIENPIIYRAYDKDKEGATYIYETTSEKEYIKLVNIKSEGVDIISRTIIFKMSDEQRAKNLMKALENAKHKAQVIASNSGRKIGEIIMIIDHNRNTIKETLYYLNPDRENQYYITVRFKII